ncbi:hypothetical protein VNI00_002261 [Paramarasmius palmivorus]|uniref:Uncharacterized protein n=1 Tax=Paramarasmius palmivorus TaxID=297713 RepID=A0AAW0E485_9AGAR
METESIPWEQTPLGQALLFLPVLGSFIWRSISYTLQTLAWIIQKCIYPFIALSPHPILLYILAPFTVFIQIVLSILVVSPYRVLLYFSDVFYPVYVFCGVACITGGLVGVLGRVLTYLVIGMVQKKPGVRFEDEADDEDGEKEVMAQEKGKGVHYALEDDL